MSNASAWLGYPEIRSLHEANFNVVIFDLRNHGQSGGRITSFGLDEAKDVKTAVRWALMYPDA